MIQKKSARYFKSMLAKAEGSHLKKLKVDKAALIPLIPKYQACLRGLATVLKAEQRGEVQEDAKLSSEYVRKLELEKLTESMSGQLEEEEEDDGLGANS